MSNPEIPAVDISPEAVEKHLWDVPGGGPISMLDWLVRNGHVMTALRAALTRAEQEREEARQELAATRFNAEAWEQGYDTVKAQLAEAHRHLATALARADHASKCRVATDEHGEYINCYRPLGGCDCGLADATAYLSRVEPTS